MHLYFIVFIIVEHKNDNVCIPTPLNLIIHVKYIHVQVSFENMYSIEVL